jgi:cytochrome c oxidase subunit IV
VSDTSTTTYKSYWLAWFCLFLITLAMVFIGSKPVLAIGMMVKALIIALFFMHLAFEKKSLIYSVGVGILVTTAVLVVLLVPDGRAM